MQNRIRISKDITTLFKKFKGSPVFPDRRPLTTRGQLTIATRKEVKLKVAKKSLKSTIQRLEELASEEKLGSEARDKLKKAVKALSHAISTRNFKSVEKAIEKISKILLTIK